MLEHIADFTAWPILTGILVGYVANRIMSGEGKGCCMNLIIGIIGSYAGFLCGWGSYGIVDLEETLRLSVNRIIREARPTDMADIMMVMDAAKKIMRQSGNMHQWGEGYPSEAVITADMERNGGFVIEDDGKIVGYFAFLPSPEPTYEKIFDGNWLDDEKPYHIVHRIASLPDAHDIFSSIIDFCFAHDNNIRIDTHRDNQIMRHNIEKHGFTYCGIIYLANGDERLAYQKQLEETV